MTFGIMTLLGIAVFGGMLGALFFQKIRFPQVVGYIVIGLLLGESVSNVITQNDVQSLRLINLFALGVIGFLVGGELKAEIFQKYARQFVTILLCEGLMSFLMVGIPITLVAYLITHQPAPSVAVGMVFGAISSATDPASTMDVIWEYRAKGVMTTAIIAIVALDDALAMTLYGLSTGAAQVLAEHSGSSSILKALGAIMCELFGALALGGVFALILALFLRLISVAERAVAFALGVILLVIGLANRWHLDVILASMTVGCVLVNTVPRRSEQIFKLTRSFSVPIYILFFVLVGARLSVGKMPLWLWGVVLIYIVGRNVGKLIGSYYGAQFTGAAESVRKYLGFGIFAQGGVAIGLAIVASEHLTTLQVTETLNMGDMVVYIVTATTLLLQLFGPAMVKFSLKKSGEAGRNITEEDVMASMKVADVLEDPPPPIHLGDSVARAVKLFTENDLLIYPVLDRDGHICGILTFEALKDVLSDQDCWQWLLVADVMRPLQDSARPEEALKEVFQKMVDLKIDQMPVVDAESGVKPLGVLDLRDVRRKVHAELLKRAPQSI